MQRRRERAIVTETTIARFERGVRLHRDWARGRNVLLAPERVIALDQHAFDILALCDGRTVNTVADTLAARYRANPATVLVDTCAMLQSLFDRRYLTDWADGNTAQSPAPVSAPLKNLDCIDPPIAVLAELTHRCPLQCPYCSNPLALEREELSTEKWKQVIDEIANLGVLQIHFSGGEPMTRADLPALIEHAAALGLYTNLITSGVLLSREKLAELVRAGLDHVQISFQDMDADRGDFIANYPGAFQKKLTAAKLVRDTDLPLTVNAVVHRQNLHNLARTIDMAVSLDAARLEVAHVQYLGWALANRAALMPTEAQFTESMKIVEKASDRLKGVLVIDHVIPDYYAVRPKKCMGGWARQFLNITPSGQVLPCHAAQSIPGLSFDSVREQSLGWIWANSEAMQKFRGFDWMKEPCRSCEFKAVDHGGCRCQALALTGEAANADPICAKSSYHEKVAFLARREADLDDKRISYRRFAPSGV